LTQFGPDREADFHRVSSNVSAPPRSSAQGIATRAATTQSDQEGDDLAKQVAFAIMEEDEAKQEDENWNRKQQDERHSVLLQVEVMLSATFLIGLIEKFVDLIGVQLVKH